MNKIVILAAGKGTRMKSELPKVLVPIKQRAMIEYLLDSIEATGLDARPIIVVSPDNHGIIKKTLAGRSLQYVIQPKQLGTGHAVACALQEIGEPVERLLVFNGDHPFIKPQSIIRLAAADGDLTMLSVKLRDFDNWHGLFYHWGRIIRQDSSVKEIIEFKDADEPTKNVLEVNPAMYRFNFSWLKDNIKQLDNINVQQEFYLTDVIKLAFAQNQQISALSIEPEEAIGINTIEELSLAEDLIK